jgi:hypothetical protein
MLQTSSNGVLWSGEEWCVTVTIFSLALFFILTHVTYGQIQTILLVTLPIPLVVNVVLFAN